MFCLGVLGPETVLAPMSLLVHYKDLCQVVLQSAARWGEGKYNMEALATFCMGRTGTKGWWTGLWRGAGRTVCRGDRQKMAYQNQELLTRFIGLSMKT